MSLIAFDDKRKGRTGPILAPIAAKAGPLSPQNCMIQPPGFGRTTAGMPFTVNLHCFDADQRRIYEGGSRVKVKALRQGNLGETTTTATASASAALGKGRRGLIDGLVKDNGDGSYLLTLEVPEAGKYTVGVEVNSVHIKDSPFDLIAIAIPTVSAPSKSALSPGKPILGGSLAKEPQQQEERKKEGVEAEQDQEQKHEAPQTTTSSTVSHIKSIQLDSSDLSKVVNVGNISAGVSIDQLRQLFAFFGRVQDCSFAGSNQFALVRFATEEECQIAAKSLNGMQVGDKPLRVELASVPHFMRPPTSTHVPPAVLTQPPLPSNNNNNNNNPTALNMQVAAQSVGDQNHRMASAKSESQIAAERAAAISRRLAGIPSSGGNNDDDKGNHHQDRSGRDRDRDRERDRNRDRDRDRDRRYSRSPSSSRSRSRSRERSGHRHYRREGRSNRDYYRRSSNYRSRDRDRDRDDYYRRSDSRRRRDHKRYDEKYRSNR